MTVADARVSAEEVERGFVSDGSKKTYHEKLAQFTFYLLDNKPEYLADGHREELQQKDEADKRRNAAARKPTKKVNRTYVREHLKAALKGIQPAREAQRHNSPIKIDGDGAISYRVITGEDLHLLNAIQSRLLAPLLLLQLGLRQWVLLIEFNQRQMKKPCEDDLLLL